MRFKLVIAYDGTDFQGWQSQPNGQAVQDIIEQALARIFKEPIRLHGASRTDSGVHSWGQVGHFDAQWHHPTAKLKEAIQSHLPQTILIRSVARIPESFHARFSAKRKRYLYKLKTGKQTPFEQRFCWGIDYPVDFQLLRKALRLFEGRHNFAGFAGAVHKEETLQKTLSIVRASKRGCYITITLVGSGFLYKMARSIVGTAIEVARGKIPLPRIREILKSGARTHEVITAPANGLSLDRVFYGVAKKSRRA